MLNSHPQSSEEIFAQAVDDVLGLTFASNQICANDSTSNPYELRNALILEEKKQKVRYKNGYTLPASAERLLNDAARKARHSGTLARNINQANPMLARPKGVAAHHIVAVQEMKAIKARMILFVLGIAINDAANGTYCPRFMSSKVASLPNAAAHSQIHTALYHMTVLRRLGGSASKTAEACRDALRTIGRQLNAGTFPY